MLQFGNILNSISFSEIDAAISLKTAVSLSKLLDELVESLKEQNTIEGMPAKIKLAATRITSFVGMVKKGECYNDWKTIGESPTFKLSDGKPIEDLESVTTLRRSKWINILSSHQVNDGAVNLYNQDECPVCLNDQKEDSCVFICQHTLCSSCTEIICKEKET